MRIIEVIGGLLVLSFAAFAVLSGWLWSLGPYSVIGSFLWIIAVVFGTAMVLGRSRLNGVSARQNYGVIFLIITCLVLAAYFLIFKS